MAIERWVALARLVFRPLGTPADENWRLLAGVMPQEVLVADVGAADTPMEILHDLGRVPRGLVVVNQVVPGGTDPVFWYRVDGDLAWTDRDVTVRWTVANASVRVWIY